MFNKPTRYTFVTTTFKYHHSQLTLYMHYDQHQSNTIHHFTVICILLTPFHIPHQRSAKYKFRNASYTYIMLCNAKCYLTMHCIVNTIPNKYTILIYTWHMWDTNHYHTCFSYTLSYHVIYHYNIFSICVRKIPLSSTSSHVYISVTIQFISHGNEQRTNSQY